MLCNRERPSRYRNVKSFHYISTGPSASSLVPMGQSALGAANQALSKTNLQSPDFHWHLDDPCWPPAALSRHWHSFAPSPQLQVQFLHRTVRVHDWANSTPGPKSALPVSNLNPQIPYSSRPSPVAPHPTIYCDSILTCIEHLTRSLNRLDLSQQPVFQLTMLTTLGKPNKDRPAKSTCDPMF